jgi:probable HAF family extracellular repeat protein
LRVEEQMKTILTSIAAGSLLTALAIAQPAPRYALTDLGTLPGGKFSQATGIDNKGLITGVSTVADGTQHAVLWQGGKIKDIVAPGFEGPNSSAFGSNESGLVGIQAESSVKDPNDENFCAYGTGLKCLPFLWKDGVLTPLATLGGNNASIGQMNSRGEVPGLAENNIRDPECLPGVAFTGTGPQVLDYEAVIWGPGPGQIRELHPLPGDTVGIALWINDSGQAVGISGRCGNTVIPPLAGGPHAVLWENDGSVHDLGNLGGGTGDATTVTGNVALAINNQGQVVGASPLPNPTGSTAFLWTKEKGMQSLGTLPGDVTSGAVAINDGGQAVGVSFDAKGSPRAVVWQKGVITDFNTLVPADSPLFLLFSTAINSRGQIVGFGVTSTGDTHGFLATPAPVTTAAAGPKSATVVGREMTLDGTASISADGKPLTYQWSIPQGSPSAGILHGNTATPSVQFSPARGVYTFQLTVTDSTGTSASDVVTVNFQGN